MFCLGLALPFGFNSFLTSDVSVEHLIYSRIVDVCNLSDDCSQDSLLDHLLVALALLLEMLLKKMAMVVLYIVVLS